MWTGWYPKQPCKGREGNGWRRSDSRIVLDAPQRCSRAGAEGKPREAVGYRILWRSAMGDHICSLEHDPYTGDGSNDAMTKLERISQLAVFKPMTVFTQVFGVITIEELRRCHYGMDPNKAVGIDGVTKAEYGLNLEDNLRDLHRRLWDGSYKPKPARRVEIPKDDGKMRELSIYCYEDKIVQKMIKRILDAVFEPKFCKEQMGYRPNRNCHKALALLNDYIEKEYTNYVVDADIRGFFDNLEHKWILKFVKMKVNDPKFLALVHKMLRAGIMEGTFYEETDEGAGQGSICSPVLANIYMHYVVVYFHHTFAAYCKGFTGIVVYADDFVVCFQYENEAQEFMRRLRTRLANFGLELAENKTRLIAFGRFANERSLKARRKNADTFTFLGFTHYCSVSRYNKFRVKRRTAKKKFDKKRKEIHTFVKENRNSKVKDIIAKLNEILVGYYAYYCITDNMPMVWRFWREVRRTLFTMAQSQESKKEPYGRTVQGAVKEGRLSSGNSED